MGVYLKKSFFVWQIPSASQKLSKNKEILIVTICNNNSTADSKHVYDRLLLLTTAKPCHTILVQFVMQIRQFCTIG